MPLMVKRPRESVRDTRHGFRPEGRVAGVGIESDEYAFDGLEVLGFQYMARHLRRVDVVARGKAVGIVAQWVALVVVADGAGEVDGVGGVGLERVGQLDADAFALAFYLWCLQLRWRHHDVLCGVVNLYVFVEVDVNPAFVHIDSLVGGFGTDDVWRGLVVPSAIRTTHACTGIE